jgi:hypothetical protein
MKSLLRFIANSELGVKFRNTLNIKSQIYNKNIPRSSSISDSFAWRTDNTFKTIFKFSDILDLFYNVKNSYVELIFFNKNNKFIKSVEINDLHLSNSLIIDKDFFSGLEDYGYFNIFHHSDDPKISNDIISNRCYLGFSYKENLYSFVHGNAFVNYFNNNNKTIGENIIKTSLIKNQIYKIQKCFDGYDKVELFMTNPTTKKIYFSVNNNKYKLNSKCSKIIHINKDEKEAIIKSNCTYFRPVVFTYKKDYIDVHHS